MLTVEIRFFGALKKVYTAKLIETQGKWFDGAHDENGAKHTPSSRLDYKPSGKRSLGRDGYRNIQTMANIYSEGKEKDQPPSKRCQFYRKNCYFASPEYGLLFYLLISNLTRKQRSAMKTKVRKGNDSKGNNYKSNQTSQITYHVLICNAMPSGRN